MAVGSRFRCLVLVGLLAGCSARQQSPDATPAPVVPDAAMVDAGPPDAAPDAAVPDVGPITIAADAAARPVDAAALAAWRARFAAEVDALGATGWSSAVVLGDAIVDAAAVGVAADGTPTGLDRAAPIGEVTRVLTALLIAALIEEGHIAWSASVGQLRPDWAAGGPTLAEMACGCYGIAAVPGTPPSDARQVLAGLRERRAAGDALEAMPTPLLVAAAGYLAAAAAPSVPLDAQLAYADQMRRRVTDPLAMAATTIGSPGSAGVVPVFAPDDGAWSSVGDLARLVVAMLGEGQTPSGGRVVEAQAVAALLAVMEGQRGEACVGGWQVASRGVVSLRMAGGSAGRGQVWVVLAPAARLGWAVRVEGQAAGAAGVLGRAFDRLLGLRYGVGEP